MIRAGLTVLLLASLPSCVTVQYSRERLEIPPSEDAVARLVPGEISLQECLDLLGAPQVVEPTESGDLLTVAWVWNSGSGWGVSFSLPVSDSVNAQLQYDDLQQDIPRLQLRFDADGVLRAVEFPKQLKS